MTEVEDIVFHDPRRRDVGSAPATAVPLRRSDATNFFKLYALDEKLNLAGTPTKAQLEKAMRGHVLAEATLIGTYKAHR